MGDWDTPAFGDDAQGSWKPDTTEDVAFNDASSNGIAEENVSKHAAGPAPQGGCFNCGQEGHNKADCPNPRVERAFAGACRVCNEEGHRAADCPTRPATVCRACGDTGHHAAECKNPRLGQIYGADVLRIDANEAWSMLIDADTNKDAESFRIALNAYTCASPEVTFVDIEKSLREAGGNTILIGKEQTISDTHTIIDLQGNIDRKFVISLQHSLKPPRPKFAGGWPSTAEENMERLACAGYVRDRMVQKCSNCGGLGHGSKACSQEVIEREKVVITCHNCKATGHRLRDCPNPRQDRNACRVCQQSGHRAADCPEPRSAEGVECKICNETGHFARDCPSKPSFNCRNCGGDGHKASDCPEPRKSQTCHNCGEEDHISRDCPNPPDPSKLQCRNCDEIGHGARECPKPRDYSRVKCKHCEQMGHTIVRCPVKRAEDEAAANGEGDSGQVNGGGGW